MGGHPRLHRGGALQGNVVIERVLDQARAMYAHSDNSRLRPWVDPTAAAADRVRVGWLADISTRHDIALPVYTEKFTSFQDANCSAPFEEIRATVEASLGCPLEEVFASFEEECIASASIAQVCLTTAPPLLPLRSADQNGC